MVELTDAERSTVESIVNGIQQRAERRRRAARTGWALLAVAAVTVPVVASTSRSAIGVPTAVLRIAVALGLALFVAGAIGSLIDSYQRRAALASVEAAVVEARRAAEEAVEAPSLDDAEAR